MSWLTHSWRTSRRPTPWRLQLAHENLAKAEVWVDRLATDLTSAKAEVAAAKEAEAAAVAAGSERAAELQRQAHELRKRLRSLEQASGRGALDLVDSMQAREGELAAALAEVDRLRTQLRSAGGPPDASGAAAASKSRAVAARDAFGLGASSPAAAATTTNGARGADIGADVDSDDSDSSLELYVATGTEKPRLVASKLRPRAAVQAIRAANTWQDARGSSSSAASVSSRGRSASKQVRDALRAAAVRDQRLSDSEDEVAAVVSDGGGPAVEPPVRVPSSSVLVCPHGALTPASVLAPLPQARKLGIRSALRAISAVSRLRKKAVEHKIAQEAVGGGGGVSRSRCSVQRVRGA